MAARTCDGKCCAVFPLQKGAIERLNAGGNGADGPFIIDMLIPLTRAQARRRAARFGFRLPWRRLPKSDLFTCRHWNETTRLCGVYSRRPRMCRDYPYDKGCDHPDCCYVASQRTRARWRRINRRPAPVA
jgi:Fe-S-cluster containining protein